MTTREVFRSDPTYRSVFQYMPEHCSWLIQIEIWLVILAHKVLAWRNFISIDELKSKINDFVEYFSDIMDKFFRWTYQLSP